MTARNVIIRQAQSNDARPVARVHVESWRQAYRGLIPDSYIERLSIERQQAAWQKSIDAGEPELWVAESPDDIVGWVAFGESRDKDATPRVGEIQAIYIDPPHWQLGIGKILWSQARQRLIARNFSSVTLWVLADNQRAIQFYESQGFTPSPIPGKVSERDGKPLLEVRYEATLV